MSAYFLHLPNNERWSLTTHEQYQCKTILTEAYCCCCNYSAKWLDLQCVVKSLEKGLYTLLIACLQARTARHYHCLRPPGSLRHLSGHRVLSHTETIDDSTL